MRQQEKPALVLLFFPLLEAASGPFPPNLACTSVTNLPLSPKLKKKKPKKKKPSIPTVTLCFGRNKNNLPPKLQFSVNKHIPLPCILPKICYDQSRTSDVRICRHVSLLKSKQKS